MDEEMLDSSPAKPFESRDGSASDLDFAGAVESEGDVDEDSEFGGADIDIRELQSRQGTPTRVLASSQQKGTKKNFALAPFWKNSPRKKPPIGRKVAHQAPGKESPAATMKSHKKVSSARNAQTSNRTEAAGKAPAEVTNSSTRASNLNLIAASSKPFANQNAHKQSSKHIDHKAQANKVFSQTDHRSFPNKKLTLALNSAAPNILLKSSSTKIQPTSEDKMDLDDPTLKSDMVKVGEVEFIQFSLQGEMDVLKGNIQHSTPPSRQRQPPRLRSSNSARPVKDSTSEANVP